MAWAYAAPFWKRDAERASSQKLINTIRHRVNGPWNKIFDGYIADISCLLTGGEQGASLMLGSRLRAGAVISFVRWSGRTVVPYFYDQSDLVGLKIPVFPSSRAGFCPTMSRGLCRTLLRPELRSSVNMIFLSTYITQGRHGFFLGYRVPYS